MIDKYVHECGCVSEVTVPCHHHALIKKVQKAMSQTPDPDTVLTSPLNILKEKGARARHA